VGFSIRASALQAAAPLRGEARAAGACLVETCSHKAEVARLGPAPFDIPASALQPMAARST
jgi:hypothetical protein